MIKDTAVQILLEYFSEGMVRTIVDALVEDEREQCAQIADEWSVAYPHPSKVIAETIRKRGQE
jgi:molybdopterin biosynthesis enzyme MoaB